MGILSYLKSKIRGSEKTQVCRPYLGRYGFISSHNGIFHNIVTEEEAKNLREKTTELLKKYKLA